MLEVVKAPDLSCFRLPIRSKFVHKDHIVRVAHGDRNPPHFPRSRLNGELRANLGLAHGNLELILRVVARSESAGLQASAGAYHYSFSGLLGAQIGTHTARAIARNLRFRSISIE